MECELSAAVFGTVICYDPLRLPLGRLIRDSVFTRNGNRAGISDGTIFVSTANHLRVQRCLFTDNVSSCCLLCQPVCFTFRLHCTGRY
jgi:hypothetical protein